MGKDMSFKSICLGLILTSLVTNLNSIETSMSSRFSSTDNNYSGVDMLKEIFGNSYVQHACPDDGYGEAYKDTKVCYENNSEINRHKIVSCNELRLGGGSKNLTFSCKCKYLKSNKNNCDSKPEYMPVHDECLFVYVGMAVIDFYSIF